MASEWFKHDTTASSDPKIVRLEMKFGEAGYARYFKILELLFMDAEAALDVSQKTSSDTSFDNRLIAWYLRLTEEETMEFISECIAIGLLEIQDGKLVSKRLMEQKRLQNEKSKKAKKAVMLREAYKKNGSNKTRKDTGKSNDDRSMIVRSTDVHPLEKSRVDIKENTSYSSSHDESHDDDQGSDSNADEKNVQRPGGKPRARDAGAGSKVTEADINHASSLADMLLSTNPAYQQKFGTIENKSMQKKIRRWAEDIERMKRLDKVRDEQISYVIKWLEDGSTYGAMFWRGNILSGKKLREQFPKLVAQIKNDNS